MIGKITGGKSFGGCVRYVVQKQAAEVLFGEGIRLADTGQMVNDFNMQRKINPGLEKAVGHISLNWSNKDMVDNELMIAIAKQYLQQMKIVNTQMLIVRHHDAKHPHLHIIYNRVGNDGKTVSDRNDRPRNVKICKALTKAYRLHMAEGKLEVNRRRLTGADKAKYEIHDHLKAFMHSARTWKELEKSLAGKGIAVQFKDRGGTDIIQGISFAKGGHAFKGSDIDRSFSFAKLDAQLSMDTDLMQKSLHRNVIGHQRDQVESTYLSPREDTNYLGLLLEKQDFEEPENAQFKKKRKSNEHSQGLGR